jgi:hypothetical protein
VISQGTCGVRLRAAEDRVAARCFGPVGRVGPACAWVQDDALVEPLFRCRAGRCDKTDAVGEEGDAEGSAGVEVLADEEVAVVEGGGCEGYDGLGALVESR